MVALPAGSMIYTFVRMVTRRTFPGPVRIYVDGVALIQSLLQAGLIIDMTITVIPILPGSGIPLFGELEADIQLAHQETTAYKFGFVQTRYQVP